MSALGHKRTFAVQKGMSALPPKADMCGAKSDVCFVPIADIEGFPERSLVSDEHGRTGQDNSDFSELTELRINLD